MLYSGVSTYNWSLLFVDFWVMCVGDNFIYKRVSVDMTVSNNPLVSRPVFTTKLTATYMKALELFWCSRSFMGELGMGKL